MFDISLVINTKNEEVFIEECILSAKDIVDEIIIVDMHSTDRTVEIARSLGAKVFLYDDIGYVEPARNFALEQASSTWILLLDADERINQHLREALPKIVTEDAFEVVRIPRNNIQFGKPFRHAGWWPDYQVRFFKKGKVTWNDQIHSVPNFSRDNLFSFPEDGDYAITHHNFRTIRQLAEKITSYSTIEDNQQLENIKTPEEFLNYFESQFEYRYFLEQGHKEGMHGFMLAKFMEYYKFMELAYFWEKKGYSSLINTDELFSLIEKRHSKKGFLSKIKALFE